MNTAPENVEMTVLTDEELDEVVQLTLDDAETDVESLAQQARLGRFRSERHKRAWFVLAGLGRA